MSSTPDVRIGVLSWDYGRPKGGMGRAMRQVAVALRASTFNISILAPCPDEAPNDPFLRFTGRFGGHLLFSLLLTCTLRRRLLKQRITLLLPSLGPGGVLLLRRPPVPAVAIVHHTYAQQYRLVPGQYWKRIFCPLERRTLSFCHHILCYSEDTKKALIDAYGIDRAKITVLPFPVTVPTQSSTMKDAVLCVCVARLEARKGVDVLLRAWPAIIEKMPQARLVIVGDGVQRSMIDELIASTIGVERRSAISQSDMQDLLARASVAFCPAYFEGFGCACAEAMAAGCSVIASDADGLRQLIVQGETGMLVPAGDSEALAAATIGALSHPARMKQIGVQAKEAMLSRHDPVAADAALCDAVRSMFA